MHRPVMVRETVDLLGVREGGVYIDGTLGSGGHAQAILERAGPRGRLLGIDRDGEALELVRQNQAPWRKQCRLEHGNFAEMVAIARAADFAEVDGIILDLGMSAMQVENPERGFSFMQCGPLDMRMDRTEPLAAADIVQMTSGEELAGLFRSLGEEPDARRIAKALVRARASRPMATTRALAELVAEVKGWRGARLHPATRVFQALRIAVNRELEHLTSGLEAGLALLKVGGRLAVLAYHSLEDRAVKRVFTAHVGRWESLPAGGRCWVGSLPRAGWIQRKPRMAAREEILSNPRARSAKLRVIERTE